MYAITSGSHLRVGGFSFHEDRVVLNEVSSQAQHGISLGFMAMESSGIKSQHRPPAPYMKVPRTEHANF